MEVEPGYKQTEVGIIPEDWNIAELKEKARIIDSLHRTPIFTENGFSMVRVGDIKPGNLCLNETLKVSATVFAEFTRGYKPKRGDIVLSRVGSYGISSFVETDEPLCMGQNTVVIETNTTPRFLYYALNSRTIRLQIENESFGSGYKSLPLKNIKELIVPSPPTKAEQEAIADALSDADALIEALEQLLTKKRHIKQGAMQELLTGKQRLPGFNSKWGVKTFGEIFDYHSTATNSRSDLSDTGDTHYIHYGDIHTKFHNHIDFARSQPPRIDRHRCKNATFLKNGDWILADVSEDLSGVGKSIEILGLATGTLAVAGLHTFLLREKESTFALGFKGHLGNLHSLHEEFRHGATGMKVFGISKTALKNVPLHIPNKEEQTAIAKVLSDMDAEIAALDTHLAQARQIKQGMMQELLTGRIRLV